MYSIYFLIADQTPTPTRFLQNCDEVGLFQDLQNVNPFDEPFRKAAEMVKSGSLPVPALPDDDTLHTPHIFPHLPEVTITMYKSESKLAASEKSSTIITNKTTPPAIAIEDDAQSMETSNETETDESATKTNESAIKTNEPTETEEPAAKTPRAKYRKYTTTQINNKLAAAKSKLQQVIQSKDNLKPKTQPIIVLPVLHSSVPPILPKIEFYDCSGNKPVQTQMKLGPIRKSNTDNVRDPIKLDTRARNRAAALRSRAKKKIFIDTLEEKLSNINKENCMLKKVIADLNKEVTRLNTVLLAHQDCPVTQALKMGKIIFIYYWGFQITEKIFNYFLTANIILVYFQVKIFQ